MTQSEFKTIKTPDGVVLHVYKEPGKNSVPHSTDGPAIKYPKAMKKADEYFIYGIKIKDLIAPPFKGYTKKEKITTNNSKLVPI
jgi:hypothetical protein